MCDMTTYGLYINKLTEAERISWSWLDLLYGDVEAFYLMLKWEVER